MKTATTYRRTLGARSLIGDPVVDRTGADIGTIEELMIDVATGRVAFAVLSFGGFLGFRDKLFAVPWAHLVVDEGRKRFVMDVSKETLETAPGFDKQHWPDLGDLEYGSGVYKHYGVAPYWS